jgi:hypothetical protein
MPKTYTTKIIGYEFSELLEDIQRDWYNKDSECLHYEAEECFIQPLIEGFQEELSEDYGATDIEVNYDLGYSQGDGCSFTAFFDVDTVLSNLDYWQDLADDLNSGLIEIDDIRIVRCGRSNYYCHENTCEVEIDWECNNEYRGEEFNRLQELVDAVSVVITNEIRDKLRDLKRDLYDAWETATSFEAYQEFMAEHNNLKYTELGEIIPPDLIKDATVVDGVQLPLDFGVDADADTDSLEIEIL